MLAYFDLFSGISGDMTLGALVDLGVPVERLQEEISGLPLDGFALSVSPIERSGIRASQVSVKIREGAPSRDYAEIRSLIEASPLSVRTRDRSLAIFGRIAEAEAEIHGCPPDRVHFHEVGGIDAIVDIVGTAFCLEYLGIETVEASKIPLGSGFVSARHGILPVPAPATLRILKDAPVYGTSVPAELVTPTGAAILAALTSRFGPLPEMEIEKIGYGAGQRELEDRPNLLRVLLGTAGTVFPGRRNGFSEETVLVIETAIDDMNPEIFGFLMERLFSDGALDVYWIPIFMKKNRPGTLVTVLCSEIDRDAVVRRILTETTSSGLRINPVRRHTLERESVKVETRYGAVAVKKIVGPGGGVRLVPEFEVCRSIALERDIPVRVVYDTILGDIAGKPPTEG